MTWEGGRRLYKINLYQRKSNGVNTVNVKKSHLDLLQCIRLMESSIIGSIIDEITILEYNKRVAASFPLVNIYVARLTIIGLLIVFSICTFSFRLFMILLLCCIDISPTFQYAMKVVFAIVFSLSPYKESLLFLSLDTFSPVRTSLLSN